MLQILLQEVMFYLQKIELHKFDLWLERLIVWSGAAFVGLLIVLFIRLNDWALNAFHQLQHGHLYWSLALTPLGTMLVVYLVRRWFSGAEGSGIPQVIASLHAPKNSPHVSRLLSMRIALGKIGLGSLAVLCGLSTGREGPSVQVGASVMHAVGRLLPSASRISPHQLMLAGGAAGIAAAFNTPLAGIVFAIEELSRQVEQRTSGVMLTAIVIGGMISTSLQGNYLYFGHLHIEHVRPSVIPPLIGSAILCGVLGGLFSKTLIWFAVQPGLLQRLKQRSPVLFAGACGLGVSLLSWWTLGDINGSGYGITKHMVMQGQGMDLSFAPLKALATLLSYFSGVPGGVFAPSLAIGAGIGNDLHLLFGSAYNSHLIYALCMASFLSAVTQAPITSAIIVMEMIDGHEMVLSLVAVTLIASMVSRTLSQPLYHTLSHPLKPPAPAAD